MFAKIYQPSPSAMQSGRGKSAVWVLEFANNVKKELDALTGTFRSSDTMGQLDLQFETLEDAVSYAKKNNIAHRVVQPKKVKRIPRSYADNFSYDRKLPWTH